MRRSLSCEVTPGNGWLFSTVSIFGVALVWLLLYKLNEIIFSSLGVSQYITWVFLPAAIRMLSVMVFEWVGAAGLFLGALLTSPDVLHDDISVVLILAALSALGPVAAYSFSIRWLRLPNNLSGLYPRQIMLFALAGAFCNVIPHNFFLYVSGRADSLVAGIIPMFVGDLVGTAIIIYLASLFLRVVFPKPG